MTDASKSPVFRVTRVKAVNLGHRCNESIHRVNGAPPCCGARNPPPPLIGNGHVEPDDSGLEPRRQLAATHRAAGAGRQTPECGPWRRPHISQNSAETRVQPRVCPATAPQEERRYSHASIMLRPTVNPGMT